MIDKTPPPRQNADATPLPAWRLGYPALTGLLASRTVGVRWTLWLAVSVWFLWPLVKNPYQLGTMHDAAYFLHHAEAAWRSWHDYGQLPAWNPWFCGGIPGLGNLQESGVSPTVVLQLALGLMPGITMGLVLFFAAGMEGAWLYARRWGATRTSAIVAAICFALSGRFVNLFADGQPAFVGFELAPWVLLGFELGMENPWASVGGGVAMALVFLEGGAVGTPMLGVLLLWLLPLHVLARLLWWPGMGSRWRTAHKPLQSLLIMGLVAVGLSALRLAPVVESLARWPREWHADAAMDLKSLWEMLVVPSADGGYAGPGTSYVGLWVAAVGGWAVLRKPKQGIPLLIFAALTLALAMGHQRAWAPWSLTTKLPVLKNLRCPFRMTFFTALFAATLAAVAVGALQRDLRDLGARLLGATHVLNWRRLLPWAVSGVFALGVTAAVAGQTARFDRQRMVELAWEPAPRWADQPFVQSLGNRWEAQAWTAVGVGSIGCFEEQPFPTSARLRGDLHAEEYLAEPTAGTVQRAAWSPHRIDLEVALDRTAILKVNQNYHRGWRTSVGQIYDNEGLLAIKLPPGKYPLTITHRDPLVWAGVAVSLATLLSLLVLGGRAWLRHRRTTLEYL